MRKLASKHLRCSYSTALILVGIPTDDKYIQQALQFLLCGPKKYKQKIAQKPMDIRYF